VYLCGKKAINMGTRRKKRKVRIKTSKGKALANQQQRKVRGETTEEKLKTPARHTWRKKERDSAPYDRGGEKVIGELSMYRGVGSREKLKGSRKSREEKVVGCASLRSGQIKHFPAAQGRKSSSHRK